MHQPYGRDGGQTNGCDRQGEPELVAALHQPYGTVGAPADGGDDDGYLSVEGATTGANQHESGSHVTQLLGAAENLTANNNNNTNTNTGQSYENVEIEDPSDLYRGSGSSSSSTTAANDTKDAQTATSSRCHYKQPGPNGHRCKAKPKVNVKSGFGRNFLIPLMWCTRHSCETPDCTSFKESSEDVCQHCQRYQTRSDNQQQSVSLQTAGTKKKQGSVYLGFSEDNEESML